MSSVRGAAFAIDITAGRAIPVDRPSTESGPRNVVKHRDDEMALARLYETYAPVVFMRCRRILGSEPAARDAVQETFARLLASGHGLLPGDESLFYLYRVSTNICLNLLRERKVREAAVPELAVRATLVGSPEGRHIDRQFVAALLSRCDETSVAIAVMHYMDGMTQVEVASVLSITRRTVFNRLRRLETMAGGLLNALRKGEGEECKTSEQDL